MKCKRSETEKLLERNEGLVPWVLAALLGGLVVRFILEALGLWPWP